MTRRRITERGRYHVVPMDDSQWSRLQEEGLLYGFTGSSFAALVLRNWLVKRWDLHAIPVAGFPQTPAEVLELCQ